MSVALRILAFRFGYVFPILDANLGHCKYKDWRLAETRRLRLGCAIETRRSGRRYRACLVCPAPIRSMAVTAR
jgi:hypothetical protein